MHVDNRVERGAHVVGGGGDHDLSQLGDGTGVLFLGDLRDVPENDHFVRFQVENDLHLLDFEYLETLLRLEFLGVQTRVEHSDLIETETRSQEVAQQA